MIASASLFGALAAAALASAASTFQLPLQAGPAGLSAESSPAGLSFDVHTTIFDPEVSQDHSVRIKKTQHFCNDSTTLYTGYLDAPSRHLFFWFAESRRDPDKDDLMLWTNGKAIDLKCTLYRSPSLKRCRLSVLQVAPDARA